MPTNSTQQLSINLKTQLTQQLVALAASRQRQLICLQGSTGWAATLSQQLIECLQLANPNKVCTGLEVTSQALLNNQTNNLTHLQQINSKQARHYLGQEHLIIVFNAEQGINPNALGALAGTLVAGGLLILVTPADWPTAASPDYSSLSCWPLNFSDLSFNFDKRLHKLITDYQPLIFNEQQAINNHLFDNNQINRQTNQPDKKNNKNNKNKLLYDALTVCQSDAIAQLLTWFATRKPQPLVITANRGRGKSGALGLFLRQLIINNQLANKQVLITAPSPAATQAIMQRLEDLTREETAPIKFIAPDALLAELPSADLLIIDEAAALPVPLLKAIVKQYPTSIFATTQAGYEGNGRGFALRFKGYLTAHFPRLIEIELYQPLRWATNCPLEKLINKLLLLDADLPNPNKLSNYQQVTQEISFSWLSQAELINNEELLEKIMALLVLAHYRTSPNNLRQLLDAPKQKLLVAWLNKQPVGLALVQEEGGFPTDLAEQIYLGKRRPQGHLLAQSLAFHAGFAQAATAYYWRIQRVLVHPSLHRQRIGSQLLEQLEKAAQQETKLDFLGSSFGATPELASFWFKQGYLPVRLGLTANQASGEPTLQLIKPLGNKLLVQDNEELINNQIITNQELTQQLVDRFSQSFINSLSFNFNKLNPSLALILLRTSKPSWPALNSADKQDLFAFCQGNRPLVLTHTAIKNWLLNNLHLTEDKLLELAIQISLQNISQEELKNQLKIQGNKQLERYIKEELSKAINLKN